MGQNIRVRFSTVFYTTFMQSKKYQSPHPVHLQVSIRNEGDIHHPPDRPLAVDRRVERYLGWDFFSHVARRNDDRTEGGPLRRVTRTVPQ